MANPVIASLEENLRHIKLVAEPTVSGFTSDRENTGDKKELTVQEFIASYLTYDYQIKKGCIFSKNTTSQSIDCVVLFPNHPRLKTPQREVIIAEGVYAAIEVKPDISTLTEKSEFHRGLIQIQSVKKIERQRAKSGLINLEHLNQPKYFDKIPGIIFSFKSQGIANIITYLRKVVADKIISDEELPDIIISIDKGILFYCPSIKHTIFKHYLDHMTTSYPDRVFVEIPEVGEKQLVWFLRLFLALPEPSLSLDSSILFDYLELDGNALIKFYSVDENEQFISKPKDNQS